jgi:hypothetical protein
LDLKPRQYFVLSCMCEEASCIVSGKYGAHLKEYLEIREQILHSMSTSSHFTLLWWLLCLESCSPSSHILSMCWTKSSLPAIRITLARSCTGPYLRIACHGSVEGRTVQLLQCWAFLNWSMANTSLAIGRSSRQRTCYRDIYDGRELLSSCNVLFPNCSHNS